MSKPTDLAEHKRPEGTPTSPPAPPVGTGNPATSSATAGRGHYTPHFDEVLAHELEQVEARRNAVGLSASRVPAPAPRAAPPGASRDDPDKAREELTQAMEDAKAVFEEPKLAAGGSGSAVPADTAKAQSGNDAVAAVRDRAKRMDLFGVSFSGGGIRSGTFCLGILQALGKLKLLRHVDYLSTVSGGGYIGGWLAAWVRREADGLAKPPCGTGTTGTAVMDNIERQLDPDRAVQAQAKRLSNFPSAPDAPEGAEPLVRPPFAEDREPSPIHHLRAHSRFLSPRVGLLSLDTWTLFAIYLRNLVVNALIFVPLLALVVLAVRATVRAFAEPSSPNQTLRWSLFGAFLALLLAAQAQMRMGLNRVRDRADAPRWWHRPGAIGWLLLAAGVLAMFLTAPDVHDSRAQAEQAVPNRMPDYFRPSAPPGTNIQSELTLPSSNYLTAAVLFGALGLSIGALVWALPRFAGGFGCWDRGGLAAAFLAVFAATLGALLVAVVNNFLYLDGGTHPALFATFGPPLFLVCLLVAGYAEVAVAGGWYGEHEREWRSRLAAWVFVLAVGWLAVFGTVVYVPQVLDNRGGTAATGGVVVLTAALRFLVPRLSKSPGLMTWAAVKVVPVVFLVALLALVASGVDRIIAVRFTPDAVALGAATGSGVAALSPSYVERLTLTGWPTVWRLASAAAVLFGVFVLIVPVNRFSLHAMYANRLIRGYLGASRRPAKPHLDRRSCVPTAVGDQRQANTFSGFDPSDDLPLATLRADHAVDELDEKGKTVVKTVPAPYLGPLPLFNATLNMVTGGELAYQDRKGDSFVLSPYFCGGFATGYARLQGGQNPTWDELDDPLSRFWNLTVGRAVTISGAAVDPNMANYNSEQFTAFLTVMNARLGWWMENPKNHAGKSTIWDAVPPTGSWHYIMEMGGFTTADAPRVHLSDGGHFENTGAYELIRRRCRFVLLVDAAENTDTTSENLANLVRRVHADLGIRIQIDTAPLRRGGADGRTSDAHCAVGQIRYDDVDAGGVIGTLLFVRSSLTGDEPPDLRNYASANPEFPHHGTANQFFDEAQFESYRGLGYHIGMSALGAAAAARPTAADRRDRRFLRRLFGALRRQWTPCSAFQRDQYVQSCVEYLAQVDHVTVPSAESVGDAAGYVRAVRQLQLMEVAWLRNDLDHAYAHPIQRGWVNVFRDWSTDPAFQKAWPVLRGAFSQGFVTFCERALSVNRPSVLLWDGDRAAFAGPMGEMATEFGNEMLSFFQAVSGERYAREPAAFLPAVAGQNSDFWLIGYGDPTVPDGVAAAPAALQHVVGFAVVFDPLVTNGAPEGTREFLLWLRGPYRMAGAGAAAMRALFVGDERNAAEVTERPLFARFPITGGGTAEQMQRAAWVQFMNDFDFYGLRSSERDSWREREIRVQKG